MAGQRWGRHEERMDSPTISPRLLPNMHKDSTPSLSNQQHGRRLETQHRISPAEEPPDAVWGKPSLREGHALVETGRTRV